MKLTHWEKVLQETNQMSIVSIYIFKEDPKTWQSSSKWATCQVLLFSPVFYRAVEKLRNIHGHRTNSSLHSNISCVHEQRKLSSIPLTPGFSWLKKKTEVEYTLCKSHRTILFRHRASLSTSNSVCEITKWHSQNEFPREICESS